jgi:uncharacterized protein involved in high-affinity Fe2+ transport
MKKISLVITAIIFSSLSAMAQCAMCTKTAAGLDDNKAGGLNVAIIYLAFIPLIFMIVGGYLYWKHNGKKSISFK